MIRILLRYSVWLAVAGMAVEVLGMAWAVHLWNQSHPESYTFLRNFVSELGAPKTSAMGMVFNGTIIISSLLMAPNLLALSDHLRGWLGYGALFFGFLSTVGAVGVGFFPMDITFILPHLVFAMLFFWSWLATIFLFTAAVWRRESVGKAPGLIASGLGVWIVTGIFLWILMRSMGGYLLSGGHAEMNGVLGAPVQNPHVFERPLFWDIAVLEWCVVAASFLWNLSATHFLFCNRAVSSAPKESAQTLLNQESLPL